MMHPTKRLFSFNSSENRTRRSLDDQLVPMINIVFLLLIFFMIAGSIENRYSTSVDLPNSGTAKPLGVVEEPFFISSEGQLFWQDKAISLASLKNILNKRFDKQVAIPVRADRATTAKALSDFTQTVEAQGFENVRFIVLESVITP